MVGFTLEYISKKGELVVIEGQTVKYWRSTGLPDFEGDLEGLEILCPAVVAEMLKRGILKRDGIIA